MVDLVNLVLAHRYAAEVEPQPVNEHSHVQTTGVCSTAGGGSLDCATDVTD